MKETDSKEITKKKKYMSVAEMGNLLGLKKTARYWLIKKNYFRVVTLYGKMWVDVESFEKWYAVQLRYHKVDGEEPGKEIKEWTFSLQEIMEMLAISHWTMYEILEHNDLDTIIVDQRQRVPKESFWKWYKTQEHYHLAESRKELESQMEETLTAKEAADLLGLSKSGFESVMRHWYFGQFFEYVKIDRKRRITKESFLLFLQKQDKYRYDPLKDKSVSVAKDDHYLTIEQASWYARIDQKTIMSWYRNGKISAIRIGRPCRTKKDDVLLCVPKIGLGVKTG